MSNSNNIIIKLSSMYTNHAALIADQFPRRSTPYMLKLHVLYKPACDYGTYIHDQCTLLHSIWLKVYIGFTIIIIILCSMHTLVI